MTIRWRESRESGSSTTYPPSETKVYTASNTDSAAAVRLLFQTTGSPATVSHEKGTLYRQDVAVDPVGFRQWRASVPYGPLPKDNGSYKVHFSTAGGTIHVRQAIKNNGKFAAPGQAAPEDMGGLIGVNKDNVEGTEVVQPALKLSVSFNHPEGVITVPQMKALARLTGKTNSTPFLTFSPGEILFLGCEGDEGSDTETSISYEFAASENIENETLGVFENVTKRGWDHAWVRFKDAAQNGHPVQEPQWLYVDQVYREADLASILGFGG